MKARIGADEASGLVHSVEGTAANVSEISQTHALLHGEEKRAGVDAGYTGVEKRAEIMALGRGIEWRVAARRSTHQGQPEGWAKAIGGAWEKLKARALVKHPFASAFRRCPAGCLRQAVCQHPPVLPFGRPAVGYLAPLGSLRSAHIVKNIFRHRKVRYRGLEKNTAQLRMLFALANLYMMRRHLNAAA